MNRLAVGSVWQSMLLLGQTISNRTGFTGPMDLEQSVDAEFYSAQDRHTHRHGRMGILGLATVHRTSARQ